MTGAPQRACRLTMRLEADTPQDMASLLENFAWRIHAGELTTGVTGGPSSGGIYEFHCAEHPSHEEYFAQLRAYLQEKKNGS